MRVSELETSLEIFRSLKKAFDEDEKKDCLFLTLETHGKSEEIEQKSIKKLFRGALKHHSTHVILTRKFIKDVHKGIIASLQMGK